jgi:hypothetical protein
MTQINEVRAVPYSQVKERVEAAAAAHDAEVALAEKTKTEIPYEKRLSKMSMRQLRGEVNRAIKGSGLPKNPSQEDSKKGPWRGGRKIVADTGMAVVLKVLLDSYDRGMNPFPR